MTNRTERNYYEDDENIRLLLRELDKSVAEMGAQTAIARKLLEKLKKETGLDGSLDGTEEGQQP